MSIQDSEIQEWPAELAVPTANEFLFKIERKTENLKWKQIPMCRPFVWAELGDNVVVLRVAKDMLLAFDCNTDSVRTVGMKSIGADDLLEGIEFCSLKVKAIIGGLETE